MSSTLSDADASDTSPPRPSTTDPSTRETPTPDPRRTERGRFIRRVWRLHFYAGVIAGPVLLVLSLTGLVILYTDPIHNLIHRHLLTVEAVATPVSLDRQVGAALDAFPGAEVLAVTPPRSARSSTLVQLSVSGQTTPRDVYVDPSNATVLGSMTNGDDIVGIANRLHGYLDNDALTVPLPSISHWIDSSAHPDAWVDIRVGAIVIEIVTVWTLVLVLTGMYLWWPRRSEKSKRLLTVRWRKGGRIRWRDLHAVSGVGLAGILTIFIVSGMPWSDYWGKDWTTVTSTVTPSVTKEYQSTPVTIGDLDRFGHTIAWTDQTESIAASGPPRGSTMRYDDVERIAGLEKMIPGYTIYPPVDSVQGTPPRPTYGSFSVVNHWPQRLSEQRTLFVDQFTGATLGEATAADDGFLGRATSYGVNLHMGTQYGIVTRILATLGCVLIVLSLLTSYAMWFIRRPKGGAGLPKVGARRPGARTYGTGALVIGAVVLAVIYPSFGATVIAVCLVDAVAQWWRARRRRPAEEVTERV